jgi:hypothetical protein
MRFPMADIFNRQENHSMSKIKLFNEAYRLAWVQLMSDQELLANGRIFLAWVAGPLWLGLGL